MYIINMTKNFHLFECPFSVDTSKNFSWPGAGSGVFSDSPKEHISTKPTGDKVSGDEGCVDDSTNSLYDPQFEPIVDLPDAIEVRTGEEDEIKGWYL
jgi:E3 SUMO-protein ligase RanBP2